METVFLISCFALVLPLAFIIGGKWQEIVQEFLEITENENDPN